MEAEVLAGGGAAQTGAKQDRGRLDPARGDDHRRRLDGQLDGLPVRAGRAGQDARRAAVLDEDALDRTVDDEAGAGRRGVRQVGDERRLLAPVLAAGVAVAAVAWAVAGRVARDQPVCEAAPLERLGHQLVRPVRLRLGGVDVDPRRDRVEVRVEVRAVDAGEPERGPLESYRLRRPQADERVDDRPAAERRPRKQADRAALAEEEPTPQVELAGANRLELPEVRLVPVAAALEHEHRAAGAGELGRDHAAAGAGADHADVGAQRRPGPGRPDDGQRLRRLGGRGRLRRRTGIAERGPVRVPPGLVGQGVEQREHGALQLPQQLPLRRARRELVQRPRALLEVERGEAAPGQLART